MTAQTLQSATYARLNNSGVTSLLSSAYGVPAIFTDVPQPADAEAVNVFPYIVYGLQSLTAFNDKEVAGGTAVMRVVIYDRAASDVRLMQIIDAVRTQMERQAMMVTGWIDTDLDSVTVADDPDGRTRQAVMLWRVLYIA
jgi:hypothetical protein